HESRMLMNLIKKLGENTSAIGIEQSQSTIHKPRSSGHEMGFILMEVLMAGAILGIALIGMNVAVARCIHALNVTANYDAAHEIMTDQLNSFGIENTTFRQGVWEGSVERNGRRFDWKHELLPTDHPKL